MHTCFWVAQEIQGDPTVNDFLSTQEETRSCGRTNCGCFTTTMHLLTLPWAPSNSWPSKTLIIQEKPSYSIDFAQWNFFLFTQTQRDYQENLFWRHGGYQDGINDDSKRHPKRILLTVCRNMVKCKSWQP